MKRLHLFAIASVSATFLTGVLVACSSDDTVVSSPDAGGLPDANEPDTAQPPVGDAATDAPQPEVDAGFNVDTYSDKIADTLCNALTRCCYGDSNVPDDGGVDGGAAGSGAFERSACLHIYDAIGFENSNAGVNSTKENIVVNQAKANECLANINTLACSLDGAGLKTIRASCFAALEGQLKQGDGCKTSLECGAGLFCDPGLDGGGAADAGIRGACAPLRGEGGNCSIVDTGNPAADSYVGEEACSSRGGGDTNLRCDSYYDGDMPADDGPIGNPDGYRDDRSTWKCRAQVDNDHICNTSVSCANGICNPSVGYYCESPSVYFLENICSSYIYNPPPP
jgi:hypothetical protein